MKIVIRFPSRAVQGSVALLVLLSAASMQAQQAGTEKPWTVKPEWVRAHEEFLASDALAGRGSATRDEQIAAEYVASEFVAYGLKPAPGLAGMIQGAEIVAPELDGKATLAVGGVTLNEGADLTLMRASGVGASAPIVRVAANEVEKAAIPKGSIVLLTDADGKATGRTAYSLLGSGAAAIVFAEDDAIKAYLAKNPNPRVPLRLAPESGETRPPAASMVVLTAAAMDRVLKEKSGSLATLTVHTLPSRPRKTFNAIGYLPGADLSAGTILLTAHLDHLGVAPTPASGDTIYNGANDDASGTTAVLELAHALAAGPQPRRSILFVCYGSEEAGELGSEFFGRHSPVPLSQLVTNLEFEMIGSQDPKMPKGTLLLTGWERSNLGPALRDHGALLGPDPYPEQHFFQRSDNYQLALQGVVAHTAAGWGTPPTYHQVDDDLGHLDLGFMTAAIQSLVEPVRWLATSNFKPTWNPGGQPTR